MRSRLLCLALVLMIGAIGCTHDQDNSEPFAVRRPRLTKQNKILVSAFLGQWSSKTYGSRESITFLKDSTFKFTGEYKDPATKLDVPTMIKGTYTVDGKNAILRIERFPYASGFGDSAYAQEMLRKPVSVENDSVEMGSPSKITVKSPSGKKQAFQRVTPG